MANSSCHAPCRKYASRRRPASRKPTLFICRNGARIKTEHMQFHIVQVQRFKAIAQQQAQHLLAIALASVRLTADKQAYLAAAPLPIYLFLCRSFQ